MVSKVFSGGDKLQARLDELAQKLKAESGGVKVEVGFLEDANYPDGTQVASIAAIQEFGGTIQHPGGTQYTIGSDGMATFRKNDFTGPVHGVTQAHTITIPPRPFFRDMIAKNSPNWGNQVAAVLKANDFNGEQAMEAMGQGIQGQLKESIIKFNAVPLKPATIKAKGFNAQLIDSGHMRDSVDYKVTSGT